MRTRLAEWLAEWSSAPIGSARLTIAIILTVTFSLGLIGFASIGFWTVVSTAIELRHYDEAAEHNLAVRAAQMRDLNGRFNALEAVCARR